MSIDRLKLAVHMQGTAARIKGAETQKQAVWGSYELNQTNTLNYNTQRETNIITMPPQTY